MLLDENGTVDSVMKNALDSGERKRLSVLRAGQTDAGGQAALAGSLHRALSELTLATVALASSQQQVQAARGVIQTLTDINMRLERELVNITLREAQVRDFAYLDELTGLPNRRLLLDRLKQAIAQAARQHKQVALLLLDLDGFKSVNDRLGHTGGDKVLRAVGKRLTEGVRGADTACRYGGDEFLVMLPDVDHPDRVAAVLDKLNMTLNEPYLIDGYQVHLAASVGAVLYPADGQTVEELIGQADVALYGAKTRSRSARIEPLPKEITQHAAPIAPLAAFPKAHRRGLREVVELNGYQFDCQLHTLMRDGIIIELTRKDFDLSLLFLLNIGQFLAREFIGKRVWGRRQAGRSRTLDTHVCRVRQKLGLIPENGWCLSAKYGFGYRLEKLDS